MCVRTRLQDRAANPPGRAVRMENFMKTILKRSGLALALLMTPLTVSTIAVAGPTYTGEQGTVAAGGYDVTSYFSADGKPELGSKAFTVVHRGAQYHFTSAASADKFKASPDAFSPAYGGHCAWAMSRGSLAPGDPTKYRIVNGKLYLNFNQQVQDMWVKDIPGFISKAEAEWPTIPDSAKFGE